MWFNNLLLTIKGEVAEQRRQHIHDEHSEDGQVGHVLHLFPGAAVGVGWRKKKHNNHVWFMILAALSHSQPRRLLLRDVSQYMAYTTSMMNNEMKDETHPFKEGARLKCHLLSNLFTNSLVIIVELFLVVDKKIR